MTAYSSCRLCPRMCGVNRAQHTGFCGMNDQVKVARAALHFWEEPCLSGEARQGSGAVFFSGCTMRCVFCQNYKISAQGAGLEISESRLSDIFLELEQQGALNINLVTAVHFVPQVIKALEMAKSRGLSLPVVYNSSGYERVETLKMLEGYIDIYLPDFKYVSSQLSGKYSGAADYFNVASAALAEMVRQVPEAVFEDIKGTASALQTSSSAIQTGAAGEKMPVMQRGVIVRHLLLPGCLLDAKKVVRYLYETYGDAIYISLMNQYTPLPHVAEKFPELNMKVKKKSYDKLVDFALELGVTRAFIQDGGTAKESFIPDFGGQGIL